MWENGGGETAFCVWERSSQVCDTHDGCLDDSGRVLGTYIHGLFHNQELRRAILRHVARNKGLSLSFAETDEQQDKEYDRLAQLIRSSLNMALIYDIAGL